MKIFNSAKEFIQKIEEIENRVKNKYIEYNNKYQENEILSLELDKIKRNYDYNLKNNNNEFIEYLNNKIKQKKKKYNELIKQKKKLLLAKKTNQTKYYNNTFCKGFNNKLNFDINKINRKMKQILLKYDNLDNILGFGKVYEIIKKTDYSDKCINFNDVIYSKGKFYMKILELFYTKLIDWKKKCLGNPLLSKKYLEIETKRQKEMEIYKIQQKKVDKEIQLYNRNCEIMARVNRVGIIPIKREDPYFNKFKRDKENEKINKKYGELNKIKEDEVYEKFIDYK